MKKILIVDDDPSILEALKIAVETEGYNVDTLLRGEDVYATVQTHKPDLLLLDLLLSGVDGSDIVRQLRSDEFTKDIPIVMISAHPKAPQIAQECGANAFLAKPFDLDDLISKVAENVG